MIPLAEFMEQHHDHIGWGPMKCREYAPRLLPQLLWCAINRKLMTYGDLAQNVLFPDKYCQGNAMGSTTGCLASYMGDYCTVNGLPPLNVLIVNAQTHLPSCGATPHLGRYGIDAYDKMNADEQREALQNNLYPLIFQPAIWSALLEVNGMEPEKPGRFLDYDQDVEGVIGDTPLPTPTCKGGCGEGDAHNALKMYVKEFCGEIENLRLLGCEKDRAETEHLLPSLDRPDVLFQNDGFSVACEIKSWESDEADILRGIFQCVKYKAILNAIDSLEGRQGTSECILIVQKKLSAELQNVANRLHVPHILLSRERVGN